MFVTRKVVPQFGHTKTCFASCGFCEKNNLSVKSIDYQVFSKNAENLEVLFHSKKNESNEATSGNAKKLLYSVLSYSGYRSAFFS